MKPVVHCAGLLLTGGTSRRMGTDKATLALGGAPMAERAAATLTAVAHPVLAIGPAAGTGLAAVQDPKDGPLVALVSGFEALAERGHTGDVIALACDLPFVTADLLGSLIAARRGADAAVPVAGGRFQPLCAVYGPVVPAIAARLVDEGARAMRDLLLAIRIEAVPIDHDDGEPDPLSDVDTPEDLERARRILSETA